jgi:hypothetical protein
MCAITLAGTLSIRASPTGGNRGDLRHLRVRMALKSTPCRILNLTARSGAARRACPRLSRRRRGAGPASPDRTPASSAAASGNQNVRALPRTLAILRSDGLARFTPLLPRRRAPDRGIQLAASPHADLLPTLANKGILLRHFHRKCNSALTSPCTAVIR